MKKILILVSLSVFISGCAHQSALVGRPGLTPVRQQELPLPTRSDLTSAGRPYVIGPFDRISIDVFGLPDLSRQVQADAGGHIAFPIAGSIAAAGMTPNELSALIATRISTYVRNPQVTVNVTDTVSNLVTVDGAVKEPGLYPVLGEMTLMRAIASAKGLGDFAKTNQVVVFRKAAGQEYAGLYDLGAIRRGIYPDPKIYANDVIVVGNSPWAHFLHDLIQAAPLLTTPLIAIIDRPKG